MCQNPKPICFLGNFEKLWDSPMLKHAPFFSSLKWGRGRQWWFYSDLPNQNTGTNLRKENTFSCSISGSPSYFEVAFLNSVLFITMRVHCIINDHLYPDDYFCIFQWLYSFNRVIPVDERAAPSLLRLLSIYRALYI